ncbi:MbnP family protein [Reichenbachiella agariperforans]|nr:MbnP family protein [Reichenbachiella agariperforans]
MKYYNMVIALAAIVFFSACDDEDEGGEMDMPGTVTLMFDNVAGDADLVLEADASTNYNLTNALDQAFNVDLLGYYISEIKLTGMEGTADYADEVVYSAEEPLGFYLVEETVDGISGHMITLKDVPMGHYTSVTFTLGVSMDYLSEGAQGGALSESNGYVWSWNSGYIGYKLEGAAEHGEASEHHGRQNEAASLAYHLGGEGEDFSNIKTITLDLGTHVMISSASTSMVTITSDVLKALTGETDIDFTTLATAHAPAQSQPIGNNLMSAFAVESVENDAESTHEHE